MQNRPTFFPRFILNSQSAFILSAALILSSTQAFAANTYTIVRGAAQGGSNYTINVTGDPIHSLHVTGVNAFGWTIYPAGEHFFSPPDWAPSVGLTTGFNWTAADGNMPLPSGGFQFSTTNFSHDYTHEFNVFVDYKDHPDILHRISYVPEPETYALLVAGFSLLGFTARRHSKNS